MFKTNEDKQDAAIRHVQILGEICSKLLKHYPDFTSDNKSIPFRDISDMRNRLIHGYFGVSLDDVWEVLKKHISSLNAQLAGVVVTDKNSIQKGRGLKIRLDSAPVRDSKVSIGRAAKSVKGGGLPCLRPAPAPGTPFAPTDGRM